MNTTEEEVEFDYQEYMKEYGPDLGEIHRGPEARQKRREAAIHNNRGLAYRDERDYNRAIEAFIKAIELNPHYAIAYNNRGIAYGEKGDYDRAIVDYTKAIELKPGFAEGYYNRGEAWLHLGEWDKAKLDLTVAMAMEIDIIHSFRNEYGSVPDFERRNGVKLPADLAAMLTP